MSELETQPKDQAPASAKAPLLLYGSGVFVVLLAALAVLGLTVKQRTAEAAESTARKQEVADGPFVRVARVPVSKAERLVRLPAEVRAYQRATLYAKVSGYLKSISKDKGDPVRKGEVVAVLESPEIEQQVISAQADLKLKQQVVKRDRELSKSNFVSQQDLDLAESQLSVAEATLRSAETLHGYQTLRAPFDGVVVSRFADLGTLLPAATGSTTAAQPLMEIAEVDHVRISLQLGQEDAWSVRVGDPVQIQLDPTGAGVPARVTRLSRQLDLRTRTMLAEIELRNPPEGIYPGAFVSVALTLKGVPRPLVPAEAVLIQSGDLVVPVVTDRKVHFVKVRAGVDDGRSIEVLEGLKGGELVALNLASDAIEGALVRPVGPEAGAK